MTDNLMLEHIFSLLEGLSEDDRKILIGECVRKYGIVFGVWEIHLKEKKSLLFIDKKDDNHGFTFSKEGEFNII